MDEKELEALYKAMSEKFDVGNYDTFKSKMQTPDDRKRFYNAIGEQGFDLGDYNEYEKRLGGVKKKVGSIDFEKSSLQSGNTISSPSPLPSNAESSIDPYDIIGNIEEAKKLENKGDFIVSGGTGGAAGSFVPDLEAQKKSKDIIGNIKKQGYTDEDVKILYDDFKDFPKQAHELQITRADGTINTPYTKAALLDLRRTNPLRYKQLIGTIKNEFDIINVAGIREGNNYNRLNQYNSLQEYYGNKQKQIGMINTYLTGEKKDKALARLYENSSSIINVANPELLEEYNTSEFKNSLDPNQFAGLKTLEIFKPNQYKQAVNILNTKIIPQYNVSINPADMGIAPPVPGGGLPTTYQTTDKSKGGKLAQETISQQVGQEEIKRALTDIGRNNAMMFAKKEMDGINSVYDDATPEEKSALQLEYLKHNFTLANSQEDSKKDVERFPLTSQMKFDQQVKEYTQKEMGALGYGALKFLQGFKKTGDTIENLATELFGSDDDKTLLQIKRIGELKRDQNEMYLPENLKMEGSPVIPEFSKELKSKADEILKNNDLSEYEKDAQLATLFKNNQDKIDYVTNPNAGKHKNFFSKANLYENAGMMGDIASLAAQSMGLGMLGAGKLVTSALPMFTTAQSDYYREAVANGEPNPMAYANLHATIMAAAGLINPKLDIVKKAFGMNTALGKTLAGVSEETWDKVISAKKPLIDKLINSASTVTKEAGKMGAVYGFGTSVANDVADKMFFDKPITSDEIINNAVKSTKHLLYSSAGLFGLTALTNFKSVSPMEKSRLWELGDNKEIAIKEIDESVLKGEITPQQGEARKKIIKDISGIIDKIPSENSKGKTLTDKQRLDYFYNDLIKNKANEAKSNLPASQAEKAEHTALVADFKNDYILEPKTDKQLESRKNQLEKSLEPKKDAEGKTIEPNEKEVKEAKAELEAINDIIENKPKEQEVDTKLSEPIEGLDEQGIPLGDNVPPPVEIRDGVAIESPTKIPEPITIKPENEVKAEVPENTIQAESEGAVSSETPKVKQATEAGGQKPPIEPPKNTDAALSGEGGSGDKKGLDKLAANIPNNNVVREYMSKDTIEKYTGETPQNNQEIIKQELYPALLHGEKVIEKSKEVFGNDYVEKLLDYVEKETLPIQNKALLYISLENALAKEKLENPASVERINKLQKLVYSKSQAFSRENALALNMARLRKIAEVGYDISKITDSFFSTKELQSKSDIEKALESDADTINKEAEIKENDSAQAIADENARIEKLVEEGVSKEVDKIYKSLPTSRRQKADKAIAVLESIQKKLRGKAYDAGLGVPVAIIDAGITTIKSAIKAGVKVADAIELGIKKIKEKYGKKWEKEEEFRKDMLEGFIDGKIDVNDSGQSNTSRLKEILIEAGFSRNATIKGEKRKILDWKKLAGEEKSIDKMKENVEKVLSDRGMSKEEIQEMQKSLAKEYDDLLYSIIEKSMNELARRNKETVTPEQKGAAKKLAELYNYGLFDKDTAEYDKLINTAIGSSVSPEGFAQAKKIAEAMQTLYSTTFKGKKLNDISSKAAIQQLEDNLRVLLSKEAKKQGNNNYRIANIVRNYMDASQVMVLNNLKQAVENPFSGAIQNTFEKIAGELSKEGIGTKEMSKHRNAMMKTIYKDMLVNGGIGYGDVNHQFSNRAKLDDYVNKLSDNQLYHGITSVLTGKATLDAMDAMFKQSITEKKFAANLIKILTHETNKNRMPKEEAVKFVSEKLTGQTFKDAQITAKEVIDKINKDAGQELVSTSQTSIDRLANDIVKSALEMGEKLTTEQINAAYKAAYKAAGEGLGHEANNPLSAMVTGYSGKIETKIQDAVKEKDWNRAAYLTYKSSIWRNMINPFVGGGTNWLVLKLEKAGLGLFTGLGYQLASGGKMSRIDLTSESGIKHLERALYNQARYKDKYMRGAIGGGASLLTYLAFMGIANTDDYREWRNKNKWAKRYLDTFTPEFLLAQMSTENKELGRYFEGVLNKNDSFDATTKLIKAIWDAEKGDKDRMWGALGEVMGSKFNFPLPWRLVKDGQVLYQGVTGKDPYNGDYSPSVGGWNGLFKGGLIEYLGYRPKKSK